MRIHFVSIVLLVGSCAVVSGANAEDWPTWRYDGERSASTSEELADQLHLHWSREYPPLKPAWPEDPRLYFDANYEPIVMGQTMFLSSSRNDSVTAIDTTTGKELWRFFADGPIRFAPVASRGRVYFGADDGCFYCLDAIRGRLQWKHQTAPSGRKVLGNERLISVWPVRGGPVLEDGKIYFTVGVWPFEGTFLYALDAETGQAMPPAGNRQKDQAGDITADARLPDLPVVPLKDKTPQGYLAVGESRLLIPCGRSIAVCLDQQTGNFRNFSYSTGATTNYHVCTSGPWLFHGLISYDMVSQQTAAVQVRQPVLTRDAMYVGSGGNILAYDLTKRKESTDRKGTTTEKLVLNQLWECAIHVKSSPPRDSDEFAEWIKENPLRVGLKTRSRLYGYQGDTIFAVDLAESGEELPQVSWTDQIDGTAASMIAADGKLFVVTYEGKIYCFGRGEVSPASYPWRPRPSASIENAWTAKASRILEETGVRDGYCLILGIENGGLIEALARQSSFQIIGVDSDVERIDRLRVHLDELGLYGSRVALHVGDPIDFQFPPYLANLVVCEDGKRMEDEAGDEYRSQVFQILRPYGGTAIFKSARGRDGDSVGRFAARSFPTAEVEQRGEFTMLKRTGALPGAADWTHEYGNPANTLMSFDERVQAPLGILWFGGPAGDTNLFYNRHFWGPSIVVVDGRMFIQGPTKLSAVDIYTGRLLWKLPLSHNESYNPGRRGNDFENVLAGFHLVGVSDGVYVVVGKEIVHLDPASGNELARFRLPAGAGEWGRIRVQGNLLIAAIFRPTDAYGNLPVELVGLDRYNGEIRWLNPADLSFPVVAVGQETVFCFDGALEDFYRDAQRRGLIPKAAQSRQLRAFDLESGDELWKTDTKMIVTWMSYSQTHDVLVVSNKKNIAARSGSDGSTLWKKQAEGIGFAGHPENLWDKVILWNDRLIDQRGPGRAYDLATGQAITGRHPITGETLDWQFTRSGHHCNYVIANPHLLTFRSDCAGFCDIETAQTGRLRGFRSGCRNSLIPAGGILNAPNFAHGCVCGYALFTSMGLIHLPEAELWNYSALTRGKDFVRRMGINFGAPGDRLAPNGVLWLDYPNVGGTSPEVSIEQTVDSPRWFQLHSTFLEGAGPRWVAASGLEGSGSLKIGLSDPSGPEDSKQLDRHYTIQLHFVEPTAVEAGQRVFDVEIEGQRVLANFDIFREAGGRNYALVKQFQHVRPGNELEIALRPRVGRPVIGGVEIVAEEN